MHEADEACEKRTCKIFLSLYLHKACGAYNTYTCTYNIAMHEYCEKGQKNLVYVKSRLLFYDKNVFTKYFLVYICIRPVVYTIHMYVQYSNA